MLLLFERLSCEIILMMRLHLCEPQTHWSYCEWLLCCRVAVQGKLTRLTGPGAQRPLCLYNDFFSQGIEAKVRGNGGVIYYISHLNIWPPLNIFGQYHKWLGWRLFFFFLSTILTKWPKLTMCWCTTKYLKVEWCSFLGETFLRRDRFFYMPKQTKHTIFFHDWISWQTDFEGQHSIIHFIVFIFAWPCHLSSLDSDLMTLFYNENMFVKKKLP